MPAELELELHHHTTCKMRDEIQRLASSNKSSSNSERQNDLAQQPAQSLCAATNLQECQSDSDSSREPL
jgi:hypothetical protein